MAVYTGRNYGPCTRAVSTGSVWPVNVARVHGRLKDALYTREHGPCTRTVLTARVLGRVHGPYLRPVIYSCTRVVLTGARNTLPVFTARDHGSVYRA